ncbi:MAG TPA: RNA-binding protein [Clostridiales bacterium]|nr:RNA-binding protein [Clostridiales bacterium]
MEQLLLDIAKALVDYPDQVSVSSRMSEDGGMMVLELSVAPEDMGKVIGRNGKIARALRSVIKAASIHNSLRCTLEII